MALHERDLDRVTDVRVHDPAAIAAAMRDRTRRAALAPDGMLLLIAADHPARGALAAGDDPLAMADRAELLRRIATALEHDRVDGVLASADILEDLTLAGLLNGRLAIGTMNRGGIAGARWGIDDRMTAYDAAHIAAARLDGGKMLLRIDDDDAGTATTLEACARAVTELADRSLMAMVEPLAYRTVGGVVVSDDRPERRVRAAAIASGLGASSAYTWLKVPAGPDTDRLMSASTCPMLVLGGAVSVDRAVTLADWEAALAHPHCRGLVIGRSLLYPPDGDVAGAVGAAAALVEAKAALLAKAGPQRPAGTRP